LTESPFQKSQKGHIYAVGVGPGSPDMMTVRASQIVKTADVIIAPRSKKGSQSVALAALTWGPVNPWWDESK
jgi:precorrin-2/cobalt-factor-2 C20-methyltransferase